MNIHTDEYGRIQGLRCHDGWLIAVEVFDGSIEMKFRRLDGTPVRVILDGVRYFAMDRFLEGNIVDAAYLWRVPVAPKIQRENAAKAFSVAESEFDRENDFGADKLFVLESSYGASVHALVRQIVISVSSADYAKAPR